MADFRAFHFSAREPAVSESRRYLRMNGCLLGSGWRRRRLAASSPSTRGLLQQAAEAAAARQRVLDAPKRWIHS